MPGAGANLVLIHKEVNPESKREFGDDPSRPGCGRWCRWGSPPGFRFNKLVIPVRSTRHDGGGLKGAPSYQFGVPFDAGQITRAHWVACAWPPSSSSWRQPGRRSRASVSPIRWWILSVENENVRGSTGQRRPGQRVHQNRSRYRASSHPPG